MTRRGSIVMGCVGASARRERRGGDFPPDRVLRFRCLNSRGVLRHELSRLAPYRTEPPRHARAFGRGPSDKLSGPFPPRARAASTRRSDIPPGGPHRRAGSRNRGTRSSRSRSRPGSRSRPRPADRSAARPVPSRRTYSAGSGRRSRKNFERRHSPTSSARTSWPLHKAVVQGELFVAGRARRRASASSFPPSGLERGDEQQRHREGDEDGPIEDRGERADGW
jgi:hypothetical protein